MSDIIDLGKWIDAAVRAMRKACEDNQKPCVAFSLLFLDPTAKPDEQWNFANYFVDDKHTDKYTEEDKERLELAFMYIQEGVRRIMTGEFGKDQEMYH